MSPTSSPITGVQLRNATQDDALCLSVLAMQVFLDTYAIYGIRPEIAREVLSSYSQDTFSSAIVASGSHITVAELNKHLIGFAQVTLSSNQELAPSGKQAELLRLYVQEPFTAVKVGTKLLAQAERIAANSGATVLWLTPWVHNHRAIAFYKKRGYTDYGLTYFTFEGESHENRVLAKSVARTCAV
jgi:diamine N-acetyltransferase